jgi:hypothetical protein
MKTHPAVLELFHAYGRTDGLRTPIGSEYAYERLIYIQFHKTNTETDLLVR